MCDLRYWQQYGVNALGIKFEQPGRANIPNATYEGHWPFGSREDIYRVLLYIGVVDMTKISENLEMFILLYLFKPKSLYLREMLNLTSECFL